MELPRIASQTSICPPTIPGIQLMTGYQKPKTPVSKQLLTAAKQPAEPQFAVLPSSASYQPSRKREEARALQNLRRRLQAVKVLQANRAEPIEATSCANNNLSPEELDNRPYLLKKILTNRPVTMVLDMSEIQTAWQDSDFITDCLCWHNVYRQRHSAPPLTMSSELCYLAQTWANHLAHTNRFYYRIDKEIGQNLFCRPSNGLVQEISGQEVATYWYSAVRQYNYGKEPDCLHVNVNAGHFTQMVWVSTRFCGVGKARGRSGKLVVVAHYLPHGNVSGAYLENVLPPCEDYPRLPPPPPPPSRLIMTGSVTSESSSNTPNSSS
ncbi:uncharacterized protein LOC130899229 [Diorhabda carinulata]|uniref:uncharacterized protein LOC130443204 n=1 Tax=Diorhabda sublineata TaxID=1163346 RepID=UPI0024E04392|nr:uncharacterized protein LOC130443204 [Diorhabda sublineata]XP_057664982.1 uncharacterized protein LOC130899229 [Diorhabda carinulata]